MRPESVEPGKFAASVRALLNEDWRRYRAFGVYWYFVKALLRRFYDRHQMPMLGAYEDPTVIARMPVGLSVADLIAAATAEYQDNAFTRLGSNQVEDDAGETFVLFDPDMEGS